MTEREADRAATTPLLRSKLRRPSVPAYFVPRPRLEEALDQVVERPLTLLIAPAGSGKTQLLSNWASRTSLPTAWLSLEEMDDDPISLWTGAIAALEALAPGCGVGAREAIGVRTDVDDVLAGLLDGLEDVKTADAVLVIDDIHHVDDAVTAASLARFAQHVPAWLHVVMAGRADPAFPLDRLRVRGQLAEMRFAELRFTPTEAGEVLARLAPGLEPDEIESATLDADGWAAGLQLIGLSARTAQARQLPASFGPGAQVLTEDYVWHEVLAMGEPDVVELLMEVSVVDRVSARLATVITGRSDARDMLLRGEAQGLFVSRLGTGDWFRIHPLVREQLHAELVRRDAHLELHARAARWLEGAGETVSALDQWLLAGRPRDALRLLAARSSDLYDDGWEAVIGRIRAAIPAEVAMADLSAMVDFAVSNILAPLPAFTESVRDAVWHAERTTGSIPPALDALNAIGQTTTGDWTKGEASAARALAGLGASWWQDPAGRYSWNIVARGIALSERWADDEPSVVDATIAMRRDPRRGISLEGIRSLGHALAGRPVDALRVAGGIRHLAPTMSILRVELALAEATARLEIGDRQRAVAELTAIADERDDPRLFAPVAAMLELVRVALDDGSIDSALERLADAESLVASVHGGGDVAEWVGRAAVEVALAADDLALARSRVASLHDPFWSPIASAQLELARGDRVAAAAALGAAIPRCPRHRVVLGLTQARAATTPDDIAAAVAGAVGLASEHDMLNTVARHGRDLAEVIERSAWQVPEEWLHRLRLAIAPAGLARQSPSRDFPELLTDRERDVLRLLPSRLTVGEIAKELYVSVNTVKFHLRVIYRKLGVNSREEAARLARSMTRTSRASR